MMEIILLIALILLATGLIWVYRKGMRDGMKLFETTEREVDIYQRAFEDGLAEREPEISVYKRGFEAGFKIGNMKDKQEPAVINQVLREPLKPQPKDPRAVEEERKEKILRQNIGVFDGTERGQKDVV